MANKFTKSETNNYDKISIICACKNRYEPLKISLISWLNFNEVGEIIIVDWNSSRSISDLTYLDRRIKIVHVSNEEYFNQPQPLNLAAKLVTKDVLLKLDTDYILNPYFNFFKRYTISETNFVYGPYSIEDKTIESNPYFKYLRGLLYIKTKFFNAVGGYNENIGKYYAWEDDELVSRLHMYGLNSHSIEYDHNVFHIPHPDKKRFENFEGDEKCENEITTNMSKYFSGDELKYQSEYVISQHHILKNMENFSKPDHYFIEPKVNWKITQKNEQNYFAEKV
jgi:hypothetical protein